MADRPDGSKRRPALRRYPALGFLAAAAALAVLLPSGLTVPSSGPSTLAEYAPVPGESDGSGDITSLGEAGSGGIGVGTGTGATAERPGTVGAPSQRRPSLKRCVGNPARQTEDPMSPVCVPSFQGDNGGATTAGVTADEIRVVLYIDEGTYNVGDGVEESPGGGQFCDLDAPPHSGGPGCYVRDGDRDHRLVQLARAYARYFNDRYQTYARHVHQWIYWVSARTAAAKRSDAGAIISRHGPFATIDDTVFSGDDEAYIDAMADRGVVVLPDQTGGNGVQTNASFRRYAPLVWSFIPDAERWAANYASYVCAKVAPYAVAHAQGGISSDGSPMNGRARRIGLLTTDDDRYPNLRTFASLVRSRIERCGVRVAAEVPMRANEPRDAPLAVAQLREADVTTVLALGPSLLYVSQAADVAKYYPEFVIAGDGLHERNSTARIANQNVMRNAWIAAYQIGFKRLEEDFGYQACVEGDPTLSRSACQFGSLRYRNHFILFTAIQAAGPRLTPATLERGMRALPHISSDSFRRAACFFEPADFSCVKDAMEKWWDPSGRIPGTTSPGCWRMVRGGRRFLAADWPRGDDVFANPGDPCDAFTLGGASDL